MKRAISLFLVLSLLTVQSGCATVVSGRSQDVMVRSKPPGAEVLIDSMIAGATPMLANLERKKRHVIELKGADGTKVTRATTRGFNWWYLGNLILGGIIGLIVDPITGAIFDIEPDVIYVDFEKPDEIIEMEKDEAPEPDIKKTG